MSPGILCCWKIKQCLWQKSDLHYSLGNQDVEKYNMQEALMTRCTTSAIIRSSLNGLRRNTEMLGLPRTVPYSKLCTKTFIKTSSKHSCHITDAVENRIDKYSKRGRPFKKRREGFHFKLLNHILRITNEA